MEKSDRTLPTPSALHRRASDLARRQDGVLFVMAVDSEYGPQLQQRFTPLMVGVGPVEAGVHTAAELTRRASAGTLPDVVVSLGSAGSRTLAQAEVYQVSTVSYRDIDASAVGFGKGRTPFVRLPATVPLPYRIDGIPIASLSTGGDMVTGDDYDGIDAEMVDMETFAVLRACQQFGIPLIGLRGISDGADDVTHVDDWTRYLGLIDQRLAEAVDLLFTNGAEVIDDFDGSLLDTSADERGRAHDPVPGPDEPPAEQTGPDDLDNSITGAST